MSGTTETKLGGTIFGADFCIDGCCLVPCSIVRCDRDRKVGNIACYIKHNIFFSTTNILSKNLKVILVDLLLSKTKPISEGTVYGPPKDTNFFTTICRNFKFFKQLENEIFVLLDMNMNVLQNGVNLLGKNVNISKRKIVVKNILNFVQSWG